MRLVQGKERDTSDEEWTDAYAAMDPISQLGWRNRRVRDEGPADQMMRDVMEAADLVHSDAMSERVASRNIDEELHVNAEALFAGSMSRARGSSMSPTASQEVDQEGECIRNLNRYFHSVSVSMVEHNRGRPCAARMDVVRV